MNLQITNASPEKLRALLVRAKLTVAQQARVLNKISSEWGKVR